MHRAVQEQQARVHYQAIVEQASKELDINPKWSEDVVALVVNFFVTQKERIIQLAIERSQQDLDTDVDTELTQYAERFIANVPLYYEQAINIRREFFHTLQQRPPSRIGIMNKDILKQELERRLTVSVQACDDITKHFLLAIAMRVL